MKKFRRYSKPRLSFFALLLVAFAVACGSCGDSGGGSGGHGNISGNNGGDGGGGGVGGLGKGPAPVDLLSISTSTSNFVILTKTGITNTGSHTSVITGNVGSSPITSAAMDNVFCPEITGTIIGVDAAYVGSGDQTCFLGNPPVANKTLVDNAVLDMGIAYDDAAGRTAPAPTNELGAGEIGGLTITPGLYKWSTDVLISTDVTLSGGSNDVWIFQIAGNLTQANGKRVTLAGGALAKNIFWQVGGGTGVTMGTTAHFEGIILSATQIIVQTDAEANGRLLAQTQVTLDSSTVTEP